MMIMTKNSYFAPVCKAIATAPRNFVCTSFPDTARIGGAKEEDLGEL